jgi:hypothetical protein
VAAVLAVTLAVGGAVGLLVLRGDGDGDGVTYPDHWAAKVQPYVDLVEEERDLAFVHPIDVEFLAGDEFRDDVTADEADLSDEDREEIKQVLGMFRAVGLIEGDVDLFKASNDLAGAGIIGYYSYEDERIRIRGTTLTAAAKSTLVHELTHALQDQHFDLGKRQAEFEDNEDTAGSTAFDALVEGDAERIETAYRDSLSADELAELVKEEKSRAKTFDKSATEIPKVLRTFSQAPYALGEAMLDLAVLIDGNDAVDDLFDEPPTTEEHLFDPWTLLEDDDPPLEVSTPELLAGEDEIDSGAFGVLSWYVLLAERIPLVAALDAADGWGGDSYVAFERDDRSCVRIHHVSDSAVDRAQMYKALQSWIAALPGAPASVTRAGAVVQFESCDPGAAADVGSDSSDAALRLALVRTYVARDIYRSTEKAAPARCFADELVHGFTADQIVDPELGIGDPGVQKQIGRMAQRCL